MCAGVLALIDRNFQGFGKELFTDAGKYVIHFGSKPAEAAEQVTSASQTSDSHCLSYTLKELRRFIAGKEGINAE